MTHIRRSFLATVLAAFAVAPAALADTPPPPAAGVAQYTEMLPTGAGPADPSRSAPPANPSAKGGAALPRGVESKLRRQGGADSAALERLATSPALGAPANRSPAAGGTASVAVVESASGTWRWVFGLAIVGAAATAAAAALNRSRGVSSI